MSDDTFWSCPYIGIIESNDKNLSEYQGFGSWEMVGYQLCSYGGTYCREREYNSDINYCGEKLSKFWKCFLV